VGHVALGDMTGVFQPLMQAHEHAMDRAGRERVRDATCVATRAAPMTRLAREARVARVGGRREPV
jgi:hypothetical protein